jgi:hypothetical protein
MALIVVMTRPQWMNLLWMPRCDDTAVHKAKDRMAREPAAMALAGAVA